MGESIQLVAAASRLNLGSRGQLEFLVDGVHAWKTEGPLLVLHYYDRQHPRAQVVTAPSDHGYAYGTAGTPSLSCTGRVLVGRAESGRSQVAAAFDNIGIGFVLSVEAHADGSGFTVRIEDATITEEMPHLYRILSVELLPGFGAAVTGEAGYLTLPNWSGCQTFFDKSYPREVRQTIYSSNDQWEQNCNMPVFGITRSQGTLCGLVAAGDFDAELICRVHWEREQANGVHPGLVYRWRQEDERLPGPREVRYHFAPPDDPSGEGYVFCGKIARKFFQVERGLKNWAQKERERPVATDYLDRFFLKIFMAFKDPQPDGRGPYHATCTFQEAQEILEGCLARGMKKITAILVGWGQDGHDGMPPTRLPVDERLGGEDGLKALLAWCREHDVLLGVHDSYGEMYSCSPEFDVADLIRHRSGEDWQGVIWSGGRVHKTCPSVYLEKNVRRDLPAMRALGLYGHHHIDAVGSFVTCFAREHPLERREDFISEVRRMFEIARDTMGSVSTEMPFGPYFDLIDGTFHSYSHPSPWHRASPLGRYFLDRTVPLLEVALHGSINCGECLGKDPGGWLLGLDWGLSPQMEVCKRPAKSFGMPAYDEVAACLADLYHWFYGPEQLIPRLSRLTMESRHEPAPGVGVTGYSDGTRVLVNRGRAAFEGVEPGSYQVEWAGQREM